MKHTIITTLAILLLCNVASATPYGNILSEIKSNNTTLIAAKASTEARTAQAQASNNLADPDVDGQYLFGKGHLGDKWEIGLSQSFLWPGSYAAHSKANRSMAQAYNGQYAQQQLDILLQATQLCNDIVFCKKRIAYCQSVLQSLDTYLQKCNKGLEYGEVSILDTNKLKVEVIAAKQKINDLQTTLQAKLDLLQQLNGNIKLSDSALTQLQEYGDSQLRPLDYYTSALQASDPTLSALTNAAEADRHNANAARLESLPSFKLGYKYANELGEKFNGLTFGMIIPLFSNRGKHKAARAQAVATRLQLDDATTKSQAGIAAKHRQATALQEQVAGYSEALRTSNNIEMLQKALDGGQITVLSYIQELRYFNQANETLLELEHQYHALVCDLDRLQLL